MRSIFSTFSAHADGERGDLWIESEGSVRKVSGEAHLKVPSDRHGSSAFAVGVVRDIEKNKRYEEIGDYWELDSKRGKVNFV